MKKITINIKQTHKLAEQLANKILEMKNKKAVVVALGGNLGSGKTTFAQGFAKALGIKQRVLSPTFVILKRHKISFGRFKNLIHIDAYRLRSVEELSDLGWDETINNPENIVLIEWAGNIKEALPEGTCEVKFEHISENERGIDIYL